MSFHSYVTKIYSYLTTFENFHKRLLAILYSKEIPDEKMKCGISLRRK